MKNETRVLTGVGRSVDYSASREVAEPLMLRAKNGEQKQLASEW